MSDTEGEKLKKERGEPEMEIGEIREQREIEFKILGNFEKRLISVLKEEGAEKVFEGKLDIQWFKNGLPRGISARVKESNNGKKTKYIWTIKCDDNITKGSLGEQVRDVREREGREKTFGKAKTKLFSEIDALTAGLIDTPIPETRHTRSLQVKKDRTSYIFSEGAFKGLRLDFDTLTEVNGEKIPPIDLVEIEDTSDDGREIKEARIVECARVLGFAEREIRSEFSALSTEALLIRLGVLERGSKVSDKKSVYPGKPGKK